MAAPIYPAQHLALPETPSPLLDVPVSAVFMVLFILAAVAHTTLFRMNVRNRNRKFAFNAAISAFCCTRILALCLRIAWAYHPTKAALGLSAEIFVYLGLPILFISNLFWAQRIVRAHHPSFGWSRAFSLGLPVLLAITGLTIVLLISAVLYQFSASASDMHSWTQAILLYSATFFAISSLLPFPIELISALARTYPTIEGTDIDNFGTGTIVSKIILSLLSAAIISLSACYRAATSSILPRQPPTQSSWFSSKPAFYIFCFALELVLVLGWLAIRVDKRFFIPDGASGPHSYGNGFIFAGEAGNEKRGLSADSSCHHFISNRSATTTSTTITTATTLPPPDLSRADSWGSLHKYMSRDTTPNISKSGSLVIGRIPPAFTRNSQSTESFTCSRAIPLSPPSSPPSLSSASSSSSSSSAAATSTSTLSSSSSLPSLWLSSSPPLFHPHLHLQSPFPVQPAPLVIRHRHTGGFDPRSGTWEISSVSEYSDRETLRPGSTTVSDGSVNLIRSSPVGADWGRCKRCGRF